MPPGTGGRPVWPARHEAVLTAFALYAGEREKDVEAVLKGLGGGGDS